MGNYTGKWGITYNPFLVFQSGRPFNITTDTDLTGDDFFNDRPSYAASSSSCVGNAQYVQTSFGCLDHFRNQERVCSLLTWATARHRSP